jgi:hypothetical protein
LLQPNNSKTLAPINTLDMYLMSFLWSCDCNLRYA